MKPLTEIQKELCDWWLVRNPDMCPDLSVCDCDNSRINPKDGVCRAIFGKCSVFCEKCPCTILGNENVRQLVKMVLEEEA